MDAALPTNATDALLALGLPGVVILVLLIACGALWRRCNQVQDARLADKDQMIRDYVTVTRENTAGFNALSQAIAAGARRDG